MVRLSRLSRLSRLHSLSIALLFACIGTAKAQSTVPDTLEQRIVACASCHGKQGEGLKANEYYPRIAGKPAGYLFNQLVNFRDRRRNSPVMNHMVAYLSDDYLREIARYYAGLPASYPPRALRRPARCSSEAKRS
jgi:cytochrome c553